MFDLVIAKGWTYRHVALLAQILIHLSDSFGNTGKEIGGYTIFRVIIR